MEEESMTEKLNQNSESEMKENVTVVVNEDTSYEKIKEALKSLSKEEKQELIDLLKENQKEDIKKQDEK